MKITLDEALSEKKLILADGSIKGGNNEFYWYLGGIKRPNQLDLVKVQTEIDGLNQFSNILLRDNVRTIAQVTQELSCLPEMINKNIKYIFYRTEKNNYLEERAKLSELHQSAFNVVKCSKSKEISKTEAGILNGNLENYFEMIRTLDEVLGLKRDSNELYQMHHPDDWEDKHTDEYLVAYAYCLNIANKNCGILTSDTDLIRLMGACTEILGGDEFLPFNEIFRYKMSKNGHGIYFKKNSQEKYEKAIDFTEERYKKEFRLVNLNTRKNDEIREKIYDLIQKVEC